MESAIRARTAAQESSTDDDVDFLYEEPSVPATISYPEAFQHLSALKRFCDQRELSNRIFELEEEMLTMRFATVVQKRITDYMLPQTTATVEVALPEITNSISDERDDEPSSHSEAGTFDESFLPS